MDQHLRYLDECAELHEAVGKGTGRGAAPSDPFERLCLLNPDMMLEIAKVGIRMRYVSKAWEKIGAGWPRVVPGVHGARS